MVRNLSIRTFVVGYIFFFLSIVIVSYFHLGKESPLFFSVGFVTTSLLFIFSMWCYLSKYLVSPINNIMESLSRFNSGDFSFQMPVFGDNCAGRIIPGINILSNDVSVLMEGINNIARSTQITSEKLLDQSNLLTYGSAKQSHMLTQTSASIEKLSSGIRYSSSNILGLKEISASAYQLADNGEGLMIKLIDRMKSINSCAKEMRDIISIIDSVAFQTNILALNAAVEAARAGNHGKGFTVVASEVRNLAHKCSDSAKSIKSLIESTINNIEKGNELVTDVRNAMTNVVLESKKIDELTKEGSLVNSGQEKEVDKIISALVELANVNKKNIKIVDELAKSSAGMKAQVCELDKKTSHIRINLTVE